jgi:hypothetical protein
VTAVFIDPSPVTTDPELDEDEPREAHYVDKGRMVEAYIEGTPVVALCGKTFVPTRDPQRYPVCPACEHVIKSMRAAERGEN